MKLFGYDRLSIRAWDTFSEEFFIFHLICKTASYYYLKIRPFDQRFIGRANTRRLVRFLLEP